MLFRQNDWLEEEGIEIIMVGTADESGYTHLLWS